MMILTILSLLKNICHQDVIGLKLYSIRHPTFMQVVIKVERVVMVYSLQKNWLYAFIAFGMESLIRPRYNISTQFGIIIKN